jgi:hypothetical protein
MYAPGNNLTFAMGPLASFKLKVIKFAIVDLPVPRSIIGIALYERIHVLCKIYKKERELPMQNIEV